MSWQAATVIQPRDNSGLGQGSSGGGWEKKSQENFLSSVELLSYVQLFATPWTTAFEVNWKGEKAWKVGASWADRKSKKMFWSFVSCFTQQQRTISQSDCDMQQMWILYDSWQWPVQWLENLQRTSQSQTCTQKKGHSHCLVVCCQSDQPQLSESQWNHYIWVVCSANWWDALKTSMPAAGIGQQNGPNSPWKHLTACCTTNTSKVELIGLQSFVSSAIFTWPLANRLPLLQVSWQLFAGKTLPQPKGGRNNFPRVQQISKHWFLHYRNFSLAKNVLIIMVPILINKDMFEPSYDDLQFMVWNCGYLFTNLIHAGHFSKCFMYLI